MISNLLKEHPKYKDMYYYRTTPKGRWSKDYFNLSRAYDYANNDTKDPKDLRTIGHLPYESTSLRK